MTQSPYEASDPYGQPPAPGAYESGVYGSPAAPRSPGVYGTPAPPAYAPQAPVYGTPPVQQQINPYSAPPAPVMPYGAPVPAYATARPLPDVRLVPPGGRLGAALLDALLIMVTFGLGWLIWSLVVWSNGQSPGKQLLGHVVAEADTGRPFGWGRMCVRDLLIRGLLFAILNTVTFGIFAIVNACMVFGDGHRTLHDRMAGSIVRYADV